MKFKFAVTAALVLALASGTAFAAGHYIITSTKQIKPSVLKSLRGKKGARGAQGPRGLAGNQGTPGKNGAVAGYSATTAEAKTLTNLSNVTVVLKTLPAGSYIVSGDVNVFAQGPSGDGVSVQCFLGSQTRSYTSPFDAIADDAAQGTLAFNFAISSSTAQTLSIQCTDDSGVGGAGADASGTVISATGGLTAVQTSGNS